MIDFVSTRFGVAPETKQAAYFLASVVAHFVRDASALPTPAELKCCRNQGAAQAAIEYLFDRDSQLNVHMDMLGGSAPAMRLALLDDRALAKGGGFTEEARATIQLRHTWWTASRAAMTDTTPQGEPA